MSGIVPRFTYFFIILSDFLLTFRRVPDMAAEVRRSGLAAFADTERCFERCIEHRLFYFLARRYLPVGLQAARTSSLQATDFAFDRCTDSRSRTPPPVRRPTLYVSDFAYSRRSASVLVGLGPWWLGTV